MLAIALQSFSPDPNEKGLLCRKGKKESAEKMQNAEYWTIVLAGMGRATGLVHTGSGKKSITWQLITQDCNQTTRRITSPHNYMIAVGGRAVAVATRCAR